VGDSGEVASVVAFLASPESTFMVGAIVAVDRATTP
jgi:NAD(P)-dependent dehydrogenase (short-subunit alcohol dehydrogenase family)